MNQIIKGIIIILFTVRQALIGIIVGLPYDWAPQEISKPFLIMGIINVAFVVLAIILIIIGITKIKKSNEKRWSMLWSNWIIYSIKYIYIWKAKIKLSIKFYVPSLSKIFEETQIIKSKELKYQNGFFVKLKYFDGKINIEDLIINTNEIIINGVKYRRKGKL